MNGRKHNLKTGTKNVIWSSLVEQKIVMFQKIAIVSNTCEKRVQVYPNSDERGKLSLSNIRKLMKDKEFETSMKTKEKEVWVAFKDIVRKFLYNYKDPDCCGELGSYNGTAQLPITYRI